MGRLLFVPWGWHCPPGLHEASGAKHTGSTCAGKVAPGTIASPQTGLFCYWVLAGTHRVCHGLPGPLFSDPGAAHISSPDSGSCPRSAPTEPELGCTLSPAKPMQPLSCHLGPHLLLALLLRAGSFSAVSRPSLPSLGAGRLSPVRLGEIRQHTQTRSLSALN